MSSPRADRQPSDATQRRAPAAAGPASVAGEHGGAHAQVQAESAQQDRRGTWSERPFQIIVVGVVAFALAGFSWYVFFEAEGAARLSAGFAWSLVLFGGVLLMWSYVRRPPPGQEEDFIDKLVGGAGQSMLLGAVLSFGFGIVNERLASEQETFDRRESLGAQVRREAGGRSFRGVDLREQSFVGLDLSDFDLSQADLSGTDLAYVDLSGADLSGADLSGADLFRADLSRANLTCAGIFRVLGSCDELVRADLSGANLVSADLSFAILFGTDLSGADLTDADLTQTNMTAVIHDDRTVWPDGFDPPPSVD
jgi:hypothetical protein